MLLARKEREEKGISVVEFLKYIPNMEALAKRGLMDGMLFGTDEGYIGRGSKDLRAGDEVWVTPFGLVLLVLRPVGDDDKQGARGVLPWWVSVMFMV